MAVSDISNDHPWRFEKVRARTAHPCAATGEDLAHWVCVRSGDVVVDVDAPQVSGWRARGRGTGYVGADGTREVVFLYDRVPAGGGQGENDPDQDTNLGQRDGAPPRVPACSPTRRRPPAAPGAPAADDVPATDGSVTFVVHALDFVRKCSPEVAGMRPSILFEATDLEGLHARVAAATSSVSNVVEQPFPSFSFQSPSGLSFAIAGTR